MKKVQKARNSKGRYTDFSNFPVQISDVKLQLWKNNTKYDQLHLDNGFLDTIPKLKVTKQTYIN